MNNLQKFLNQNGMNVQYANIHNFKNQLDNDISKFYTSMHEISFFLEHYFSRGEEYRLVKKEFSEFEVIYSKILK